MPVGPNYKVRDTVLPNDTKHGQLLQKYQQNPSNLYLRKMLYGAFVSPKLVNAGNQGDVLLFVHTSTLFS